MSVNGLALFVVFVIAKTAVLWGREIPWSPWTVIAYVWQDALVAVVYGAVAWLTHKGHARSRLPALLYWTLTLYVAVNIPVAIVLSTPLTWPMLRATSGTLADSILLYATWSNVLLMTLTLAAAFVLPRLLARLPKPARAISFATAAVIIVIGPAASSRVDTIGLHRNFIVALGTSALPHVAAHAAAHETEDDPSTGSGSRPVTSRRDWTTPPVDAHEGTDASHLRGRAAGRNVVLVSLESTAAQYLRLYGGTHDITPNLDKLARHAVVFDNAYAAYPESIKGLFSILCSTFPAFDTSAHMHGAAPCRSIAAVLGETGYRSALFHSGRFAYLGMESIITGRGYETLEDAGDIGGNHESSFGVDEGSTVARMLSWIDRLPDGDRFFLTYLPIAGHHPYETPEPGPFPTREEIGRYRNALHYADRSLGALIDGLRARGLERNTVWIVLGDHGEALGQHEGNYGHTFFLYDENVRVPFLIAAPGIIAGEQRSRTIVSLVDTAPTILDLLGISIPARYQGHSALDGRARMALFFTDYSLGLVGLRDGRWKFVHELDSGRSKLFDLQVDPREMSNVSAAHRSRVAAYEHQLRAWSAAQKTYLRSGS